MSRLPSARAAAAAMLLAAMISIAAMTSGAGAQESNTLPVISISATGGVTSVTEGNPVSFTVTMDTAQTAAVTIVVGLGAEGNFTEIPSFDPEEYLAPEEGIKRRTIDAGETEAIIEVATSDDAVDEENGSLEAFLIAQTGYSFGASTRQTVDIEDNDPTLPPEKMDQPTVLPTDGGMQLFWAEPAHAGERPITGYTITWRASGSFSRRATADGDRRHHSVTGLTNGVSHTVEIQACKGSGSYCSAASDQLTITPTDSGPAITGPQTATLPEEAAGTVGQYTASTSASTTWRLGGDDAGFFAQTVNSSGDLTLILNAGTNFERRQSRNFDNTFDVTIVATDNSSQASTAKEVSVTVTDVDETPTFSPSSLVKGPYIVGEKVEILLPAPKADETPITYLTTGLPPGLTRYGTRGISGTPTTAGTYTAIHTATDRDGDSGSLSIEFTVTSTDEPDKPVITTKSTADGTITLEIELGHGVDSYEVQQYQDITPTTPSSSTRSLSRTLTALPFGTYTLSRTLTSTGSTGPTKAEATVGGLLNGVQYRYKVVSRNATGSSTSEDHTVALQAVPPTNLDLEPRPYRQAALLWDTSANASNTTYSLMIRATNRSVARATVADAEAPFLISLDDIVDGANNPAIDRLGLGNAPYAYQVTLRANGIPGTDLNDSPESEPLIIIDTPITRVDGATPANSTNGQMEIHWASVNSIICQPPALERGRGPRAPEPEPPCLPAYPDGEYQLRYRKLASGDDQPNWDRYQYDGSRTTVAVSDQGPATIGSLELERIYAVQLIYIAPLREGAKDRARIYAAREAYGRPAKGQPEQDRVATFPMYGYWPYAAVDIKICENTFAITGHKQRWVDLITHALREWEESLHNLVAITVTIGACEMDNDMTEEMLSVRNNTNEIFMVKRTDRDESLRSKLLERWYSIEKGRLDIVLKPGTAARVATEEETSGDGGPTFEIGSNGKSIDMLLQYETMQTLSAGVMPRIPGVDSDWDDKDVRLNTCRGQLASNDYDRAFEPYATIIHEAGHMLGLSEPDPTLIRGRGPGEVYRGSHPTIAETVMNYDEQVPGQITDTINEPDCSPHPMDIMAVYALHQNQR